MYDTRRRPSLRARIVETQRRRAIEASESRTPRRRIPSFTEQYQGTPFVVAPTVTTPRSAPLSRGRTFVLVSSVALVGTCAMFLVSPLL